MSTTEPVALARLFRDVTAAGTRHQRTVVDQTTGDGLAVHCADAGRLPDGVASPYCNHPDDPGAFLVVDRAGPKPPDPHRGPDGTVPPDVQAAHDGRMRAWRDHRDLYDGLFAARTPGEHLELVVAVGRLDHRDHDGERHARHLAVAPAMIELDQRTGRMTVTASDAFRVEHNWIDGPLRTPLVDATDTRPDAHGMGLLDSLADDADTHANATRTWQRAVSVYGQDAAWQDRPAGDAPVGQVRLSLDPVLLLRRKDTSHLLALLTGMSDDLAAGGHVSGPLTMLADIGASAPDLPTVTDRPALPRPANDEQRSMLEHARKSPHTVIQGPPGTGKTHTIANLAAVLLAEGRRVLVTAENDRALKEVQGKLPPDMQPLLLPLLKDKGDSGLARSVTALVEAADRGRRGARTDREPALITRRDQLDEHVADTIQQIRDVDADAARTHQLGGHDLPLAGHVIALDTRRDEFDLARRYLTDAVADPIDATTLTDLFGTVTDADRELAGMLLLSSLPSPAEFAEQMADTAKHLSALPGRGAFDLSELDPGVVDAIGRARPHLARLPATPYATIDRTPGEYRQLAADADAVAGDINHGVTCTGVGVDAARAWLGAYLDLPGHYRIDPGGLADLLRRTHADAGAPADLPMQVATATDPAALVADTTDVLASFRRDPTGGLMARYVTDLRTRSTTQLDAMAAHAADLAGDVQLPPSLPVEITAGAPPLADLREQAIGLRLHLEDGGKMTRLVGIPGPVKAAAGLLAHVTVGGSAVDTVAELDDVLAWLDHRIAVSKARNWAGQHGLDAPAADVDLHDWLSAIGELPKRASDAVTAIDELRDRCHLPATAETRPPDQLVQAILTAACRRVHDDLADYAAAAEAVPPGAVRVDGMPIHDDATARVARAHLDALAARERIAAVLPPAWAREVDLHDRGEVDPLVRLCELAAIVAGLPGPARPQTCSEASIGDLLDRAVGDRARAEVLDDHTEYVSSVRAALASCAPASPATVRLLDALDMEDPAAWRDAHAALVDERARAARAARLDAATARLRDAHPRLVASFTTGDTDAAAMLADLGGYQDLMTYRRQVDTLLAATPDVRDLHTRLAQLRIAQQDVEAQLASERCWARAVDRLADNRALASALSNLQKAERAVPKTRTAKSYQRKLRAMRAATREAAPAIPCWVMPIDKVAELIGYPTGTDRFDVVIVDEASQAWFPSAFLYAIAEQVVVVGDHLQTSPADTSVAHDEMVRMVRQHVPTHRLVDALDGEFSLYDIAATITAPSPMADHFRCVPPIIELSNRLCYAASGHRLVPARTSEPGALDPIRLVHVPDGHRRTRASANLPEIDALVERVVACATDAAYDGMTFGVIVHGPNLDSHTKQLRSKLLAALGTEQMAGRQIEVGSPAQYQGAERDVVFLSLVATPDESSGSVTLWPHELTGRAVRNIQKLNVAVSRARDQLWVFHSFTAGNLKPGDVRHVVLAPPATTDAGTLDVQLARCDTQFERDVVTALDARPEVARVRTQVEAMSFHIDVVVEDHRGHRLAVECDGDPWHTADADVARDLYRQRTLETLGWRFHRFLASEWYADPDGIVEQVVAALATAPVPDTVDVAAASDTDGDIASEQWDSGRAEDGAADDPLSPTASERTGGAEHGFTAVGPELTAPTTTAGDPRHERLVCENCGDVWTRPVVRGRKPRNCPDCS